VIDPEELWDARQVALDEIADIKADLADLDNHTGPDWADWVEARRVALTEHLARREGALRGVEAVLAWEGYPLERPLQEARP